MKLIYVADGCNDDREAMKQYLELSGFEVQAFEELHGLQVALNKQAPDLLLLEVHHSDGDGFSNGLELQDPTGTWRTGQPAPGVLANVSNPGDPLSTPPPTSVKETGEVPNSFALSDNFPNPFNPSTRIRYSVVEPGTVKLEVYSLLGEKIFTLVNGFQPAGSYEVDVTFASAPSGLYLYRLESEGKVLVKKMNLLK